MRWWFLWIACFLYADPAIVFVHIGPQLPAYLDTAASQARLFNPETPIYIVGCKAALHAASQELKDAKPIFVACEELPKGSLHEQFLKKSKIHKAHGGFWIHTTLRFFYLADLIREHKLGDVFHLENDIMLYTDLKTLLPTFEKYYPSQLAITFDNDERGIAGLVYVPHLLPLNHFLEVIVEGAKKKDGNDMIFLSQFRKKFMKKHVDSLPIIMSEYTAENELVSRYGFKGSCKEEFTRHVESFQSIFDAAAIGQYLGGVDSKEGNRQIGYINERCVFNPSLLKFEWEMDGQGRRVPFAVYKDKKMRINNLHIHSKQLQEFKSR